MECFWIQNFTLCNLYSFNINTVIFCLKHNLIQTVKFSSTFPKRCGVEYDPVRTVHEVQKEIEYVFNIIFNIVVVRSLDQRIRKNLLTFYSILKYNESIGRMWKLICNNHKNKYPFSGIWYLHIYIISDELANVIFIW